MQEEKFGDAINVFAKWGAPAIPENFALYKTLTLAILALQSTVDQETPLKALRKVLFKLVPAMQDADINESLIQEFQRLSLIVHLANLKDVCKHNSLLPISAKLATGLIRYAGDIPADKAYYNAGISCKEVGVSNLAFIFLNRYLDLAEAIEEGEATILENADFEKTDVPYDIPLPRHQYIPSEEHRENVKSWVLQVLLDPSISQSLSMRPCENCSTDIYEASLTCWQCKHEYDLCVVSGYPIMRSNKINCTSCGKAANREDWNKYLMKMKACPWCENPQTPSY
jgi:intraflagellar transport protein 172